MVDFNKIKIEEKLGSGMLGTTYLAEYKNKKYALKIQHILPEDKIKDFKNEMWRELDLYNYINKLSKEDKIFFTRLYGYQIYDNCKHIQERPFNIDNIDDENLFVQKLKKLDESDWCVKYLLDYKGNTTLLNFLQKNKLTDKQLYSICLQICKIICVLYKGGYSHNDLHTGNIMINKTNKKYFNFMNKNIQFEGYCLSAIDYGMVLHKKFQLKYEKNYWGKNLNDRKKWLFREIFDMTMNVLSGLSRLIEDCKLRKKILPFERKENVYDIATKLMLKNHPDFYRMVKDKYIKKFPKAEQILNIIVNNINNKKSINDLIVDYDNKDVFWDAISRITYEFQFFFPEKYSEYWKWCSFYDSLLPKEQIQEILLINNTKDYIKYFINKLM